MQQHHGHPSISCFLAHWMQLTNWSWISTVMAKSDVWMGYLFLIIKIWENIFYILKKNVIMGEEQNTKLG